MASLVHSFDHIIAVNNHGCSAFERGDLSAAMSHFKTTLLAFKEDLVHNRQTHQESKRCISQTRLIQMPMHLLRNNVASRPLSHAVYTGLVEDQRSDLAIYSSTMRMLPGLRFSEDRVENTIIYTSMVVFNLALTLHLQGLGTCCRRSLEKAQALYSNIQMLLDPIINECYHQRRPTQNALLDLFVLAMLNNIALIHKEFAEHGRAEIAFQRLMGYAEISNSFGMRSCLSSSLYHHEDNDEEEQRNIQNRNESILESVDSMLLNATVMGCFNILSAAPAA